MVTGSYRDLEVWQKAMDLVVECYRISETFPKEELDDVTRELRQAVVSVPTNIAKGHGMLHTKEHLYHISIAYGSLMEVETHLQIAARLSYLEDSSLESLLVRTAEISRMLK